jgi:hypothetical protein
MVLNQMAADHSFGHCVRDSPWYTQHPTIT